MQTQRNAAVKQVLKGSCSGVLFGGRGEFLGEPGSLAMLATLPSDFSQKQVALDWSLGPWPSLGKLSVVSTAIGGFLREPGPEALAGRTLLRFSSKNCGSLGVHCGPRPSTLCAKLCTDYARPMREALCRRRAGMCSAMDALRQESSYWAYSGPLFGLVHYARSSFHACFLRGFPRRCC